MKIFLENHSFVLYGHFGGKVICLARKLARIYHNIGSGAF
jgi:hypothetical protein